mgnify:CR=1 FL=1
MLTAKCLLTAGPRASRSVCLVRLMRPGAWCTLESTPTQGSSSGPRWVVHLEHVGGAVLCWSYFWSHRWLHQLSLGKLAC